VLAQAVAALGLMAVAAMLGAHAGLIGAWANYANTAPLEKLMPLAPQNVVLMNAWPYRTLFHNEFERVDYRGARCYIIADAALEFLLFCPDSPTARHHTIRHDDPALRSLGIIESVFTGLK